MDDDELTSNEAARLIGFSRQALAWHDEALRPRRVRVGRRVDRRYSRRAIEAFKAARDARAAELAVEGYAPLGDTE